MSRMQRYVDTVTPRATAKFEAALQQRTGMRRLDSARAEQVARFRAHSERMFPIELRVRMVLGESRAPQAHLFAYLNFAREVDRINRTQDGPFREGLALACVMRYEDRGLARELLLRVCREAFDIDPLRYNLRDRDGVSAEVSRPSDGVGTAPESGSDQSQAARD